MMATRNPEVVFGSGGIDKLEIYRRLKISEVWFWEDRAPGIYHLRGKGSAPQSEKLDTSAALPELDLDLLLRCVNMVHHVDAIKTF